MLESIGKKLAKTRLEKGLTVDEAAHATKMRPEKILALEHDDYSRFPSNAYVKGFLQIYGRYLGVDVGPTVRELENPNPVSIADYQYLNHEPPSRSEPDYSPRRFQQASKPSLVPLIVFILLLAALGTGGYLYLNAKRLGPIDTPTPVAPAPNSPTGPAADAAPQPAPDGTAQTAKPEDATATATPALDVPSVPSDQELANQPPPQPVNNEVLLEPLHKTWVKVCKDGPDSAPIFEDYLYTNAPPLRLVGPRFYIEVRDEHAVAIRKNGSLVAYQSPGITIQ